MHNKNKNMSQNYQNESRVIFNYKTWFELTTKVFSGLAVFNFGIYWIP